MKVHSLFLQVGTDDYNKLKALALEMQISKASTRTLIELFLFGKSISNPEAQISHAQQNQINKALNSIKNELASRIIPQSIKTGGIKKGKQPDNINGSVPKGGKNVSMARKPRRNL